MDEAIKIKLKSLLGDFKKMPAWLQALVIILIFAAALLAVNLSSRPNSDKSDSSNSSQNISGFPASLRTIAKNSKFSIYYPTDLPGGFKLNEDSIGSNSGIVYYSFSYSNDEKLVITQQAKPALTEELVKTREFNTSLGKAYIANLNGNTAGFVRADTTLVILNTSGKIEINDLQQLMVGLQKVD